MLVGAPKDSFKSFNMSGAIYKCPFNLDRTDDCEKISVDFTSSASDECIIIIVYIIYLVDEKISFN